MNAEMLKRLRRELSEFLDEFTRPMGRSERRGWAMMFVRGLLLDGARKSVEPMAMIERAGRQGFTETVLADSAFGTVTPFRSQLTAAGWTWRVGIDSTSRW